MEIVILFVVLGNAVGIGLCWHEVRAVRRVVMTSAPAEARASVVREVVPFATPGRDLLRARLAAKT